jgi:hypothetical protein
MVNKHSPRGHRHGPVILNVFAPKIHVTLMNIIFRMFDDSRLGKPEKVAGKPEQPTAEQVALAQLVKGVHY